MPGMGRPVSDQERRFQQVKMANTLSGKKRNSNDKAAIIENVTGYKEKTVYDSKRNEQMDKDGFLKLLTHQLQNQDPSNPMEQDKLAGEMAQFSQLEQLTNLNEKFASMQRNQDLQEKFFTASFVGKEIVTNGSSIKLKEPGDDAEVLYNLSEDSKQVLIRLLDNKNNIVAEMWKENVSGGSHIAKWDGQRLDGAPAGKGEYRVQVRAWDKDANPIKTETKVTGLVKSVEFKDGEPLLNVGNKKVYLRDVDSFHLAGTLSETINSAKSAPTNKENLAQGKKVSVAPPSQNSLQSNRVKKEALNTYEKASNIYE